MEYLFEYIKSNTKYAAKSVFGKFKEYLPFLAAFFVIQCVFFTLYITSATNSTNAKEEITGRFDSDVVISGMTYNQSIEIEKRLFIKSLSKNRTFENYRVEKADDTDGGDYRIYVVMREGAELDVFTKYYVTQTLGEVDNVKVETTPLYDFKLSSNSFSDTPPLLLVLAICLISVVAVIALYAIRINNQKFMYGIYITFGANLKKLISTAVFEMMLLAVLSFLPAAGLTYLFAYIAYSTFGIVPIISFSVFIKVLISVLIISIAGAYLPMKLVSKKTPLSLISADDNSNLCASPSRSTKLLKKSFPRGYEIMSIWRFRKYYVKLLLSSVVFTSVFICGFYISDMFVMNVSKPIEEFGIINRSEANYDVQTDDLKFLYDEISGYDNVKDIKWNVDKKASEINALVLMSSKNAKSATGLINSTVSADCISENMQTAYDSYKSDGYTNVTNSFKYSAFNKMSLDYIAENFKVEGDVYSVLNDKNTVIVSEEIYNSPKFDFEVGDKIILTKHIQKLALFEGDYFDTVGVLQHLVEQNEHIFYEYTVGAVIKNYGDSEGCFTIGLNENDYTEISGNTHVPRKLDILLLPETTVEEADEINDKLISLCYYMGSDYDLFRSNQILSKSITRQENQHVFAILLSSLVVIMSPVVWFFSQSMFFNKRKKELFVLRAFGTKEEQISRLFTHSGGIMAIAGFVLATLMSIPASYIIYMTMNSWLPSLGFFNSSIRYEFYLSPIAVTLCAIISASSGFLAAWLPYRASLKKANKASETNEYKGSDE